MASEWYAACFSWACGRVTGQLRKGHSGTPTAVSASLEFVVNLDDSAGNVAVPPVGEQFVELWVGAADPTATSGKIRSSLRVTRISSPIALTWKV
ncbi:hypothetical protein [Rhodococcus sp. BH5]|uniref:hypothetical protein n=1 Tax=Rhodococcus sp. BH5 TaxID=2871702 RepID=UPI003FA68E55